MSFAIIVAADAQNGIGKDGQLPWKLPGDMAYFKRLTSETEREGARNAVIMGRKTWESIPKRFRPLRKRLNIVVSRQPAYPLVDDVLLAGDLERALRAAAEAEGVERIFVIGGAQIYRQAMTMASCEPIFLTRIEASFDCDTFLPKLGSGFTLASSSDRQVDDGVGYVFQTWQRSAPDEIG